MSRLKIGLIFSLIAILIVFIFSIVTAPKYELVVFDQETQEEYLRTEVQIGDILELSWRHSVELTLWIDYIEVIDEKLKLIETRFESFGAGVSPTTNGEIRFEDGYVVMSELEEIHESYKWIHSQHQKFTLSKDGNNILHHDDIPHHQKVEMVIEKR